MKRFVTVSAILLVGVFIGTLTTKFFQDNSQKTCVLPYKLINSSIGCTPDQVISKQLYTDFIYDLEVYLDEQKKIGTINRVSIFFRDLMTGPTFGISEKENFAPASLLKLPLFMSYLNTNKGKEILNQKIAFRGNANVLEQTASMSTILKENNDYTVKELLNNMITDSDNVSYLLLFQALDKLANEKGFLEQTMIELGLVSPRRPTEDTISVKSYASLFRQLFNASYLTPEMSEYALGVLTKSSYKKGLTSGIPSNIKIAHKYGERSGTSSEAKQLHDCGVVYYPKNPYLLCIMTQGTDFLEMESVIQEISRKVYDEIDSRRIR